MSDRDDFSELIGSARNVTKRSLFYFNGRIRYGTKGEKVEERLLCMDAFRVYICSTKIPVKIESQFNILTIKLIDRSSDSHVIIETDEKQTYSLYSFNEKASLQPFLIILIRSLHAVFPHRLQAIVEIRPENEYDKLLRLSNESYEDTTNDIRPCGGFSVRYECACDFFESQCHRSVQNLVDTAFAHRTSREFTFREFESLTQKDWLPIISALRHNDWFTKLSIEHVKLSSENLEELCTVMRLCRAVNDLRLIDCNLSKEFATRFSHCLSVTLIENLDLSFNPLEDKGLIALCSSLQQRKLPIRSLNLQSCSISHKSLQIFNTALISNSFILKNLRILNISGNRIKEESCVTLLFSNSDNVLEELHLSDIEFSLESFFNSLATMSCNLRRLFISSTKSSSPSPISSGGVKSFFTKNQSLEILQLSNANLSLEFLRELCDGLHSNIHLNKLDLRLSGNSLESFVREYAHRFATIPSLIALDLSACDLDNEIATLLTELKKNRKLKSLHLGRNFTNTKAKNMSRTISSMRELIIESELQYFSLSDSKLKENLADVLLPVIYNTSLTVLDIRNSIIQYLPVPITDIIQMKTERDRMEKLQYLMNKLDTLCARNQELKENISPPDSLLVTTAANLTRERSQSWDHQRQLMGDQTSLEYVLSCLNRPNSKQEEVQSFLSRTARIAKISSELYDFYVNEEDQLKEEWKKMCKAFEEKLVEKNERLSRKFYQLFKEQTMINYDDKLQEQIRTYFTTSKENIDHLLQKETPARLATYTRECYINVATCLQKRAYDTTNDMAVEMQKQLETSMLQNAALQMSVSDGTQHPSTIDRIVNRGANAVYRITHKHGNGQPETADDSTVNRSLKKSDSNECLTDPSPKPVKAMLKDDRLSGAAQNKGPTLPAPTSPKPPPPGIGWRRSVLVNTNESETAPTADAIYNNVPVATRLTKNDTPTEDEGDLIEHDLLDLVEQEQQKDLQKNTPPAIPAKKRLAPVAQDNSLDIDVESSIKLVHPGKDRPRRANIKPPVKRGTNGAAQDSSSDGGLDNDDNSIGDTPPLPALTSSISTTETAAAATAVDTPTSELPPKTAAKIFKSGLKPTKSVTDELSPPPVPAKTQQHLPTLQARSSNLQQQTSTPLGASNAMSRSASGPGNESSQIINSDPIHEPSQTKSSLFSLSNKDEQKEAGAASDTVTSPIPPALNRSGKPTIGTRVLPALEPNGEAPPVKLRHFSSEKKVNPTTTENSTGSEATSAGGDQAISDNEQYKRLSVKERARMLTTTIPPMTLNEKKPTTSPSNTSVTSPYTPRNNRRIIEQVNLFC
ncbi:unnamed protein product [Adineta ricciae]|uniref:CARMIL pleckstrin homology domain-containing protein n=1 Tax=Adineta ricciae TaxID=249248 RepID=A0A813WHL1_ADIRI|nr:unnamed protein product [Adineta ricciae]